MSKKAGMCIDLLDSHLVYIGKIAAAIATAAEKINGD
jgi:hypothetical protein